MVNFLSRFSIRQQILIGFVPVLLILFFLAFSSFKNYQKFEQNFGLLRTTTQENIIFLQIERDIIELQRNVLVYSYVGYNGVLRKVEFLQTELEKKFEGLKPIVESDDDIEQRFQRMVHHYIDYKQSFQQAIIEKNKIAALDNQKYLGLEKEAHQRLNDVLGVFLSNEAYKMAYRIGQIEQNLYQTSSYIEDFQKTPDSVLVKETRLLIAEMQKQAEEVAKATDNSKAQNILNDFQELMKEYRSVFGDITRANRSYLNLVNVVLAGKAAEIGKLSSELDVLISKRSEELMTGIQKNSQRLQNQFLVLSFFAAIIGIFSSILIASGIAGPVKSMASTLLNLSTGKVDTEIPGQARRDEVGQMAMAANEFKVMAKNLEYQTKELEEFAYRTSHDLRSPLVSSIALLQLTEEAIKEKDYDKAQKKY